MARTQRDHIAIFAKAVAYRSHGRDIKSALRWNGDSVQYPISLPETVLLAYTGRPVTDLIEHEMLSSELTIVGAKCTFDGKKHIISVEIEQPRLLFCNGSGRTWRSEAAKST